MIRGQTDNTGSRSVIRTQGGETRTSRRRVLRTLCALTAAALTAVAALSPAFSLSAKTTAPKNAAISPALDHIANRKQLVRSTLAQTPVCFSADDFDGLIGAEVPSITLLSLPEASCGKLTCGGNDVRKGQTIERAKLSALRFSPAAGTRSASFRFGTAANQAYGLTCSVFCLDSPNLAPTAALFGSSSREITVPSSMSWYGNLRAADPEGDALTYRIVEYPLRGTLYLSDSVCGSCRYTPDAGFAGEDSFSYIACDRYGGASEEIRVSVSVRNAAEYSTAVFADYNGQWWGADAVKAVSAGLMSCEKIGGGSVFDPSGTVTRSEFLSLALDCAGIDCAKAAADEAVSVFADADEIPSYHLPCVAKALECGIISPAEVFSPSAPATRGEAAVMLASALEYAYGDSLPAYRETFTDQSEIPVWARDAFGLLGALGIIGGSGGEANAAEVLTRAEAAALACAANEVFG